VCPSAQGPLWPKQDPSTSKLDRRVSDQKAAKELANIIRQLRVATRPTSRRVRCRKAVGEVSLPGSCHSSSSADDPERPDDVFMDNDSFLIIKLLVVGARYPSYPLLNTTATGESFSFQGWVSKL